MLSDSGSEFKKYFEKACQEQHITHWHPRCPKMNAHCERYNRTLQEEFVLFHEELLPAVDAFNHRLTDWLYWYNCERPPLKLKGLCRKLENIGSKKHPSPIWGGIIQSWWSLYRGNGRNARIRESYAVNDRVIGSRYVGGLVGRGRAAYIVQSYTVNGEVMGNSDREGEIGSLVGRGWWAEIVQSYVINGEVSGYSEIGGLVGDGGTVHSSYWDRETSGEGTAADSSRRVKTSIEMKSPTNYGNSIYSSWENNPFSSGTIAGVSFMNSRFCYIKRGDVWNFDSTRQYPALNCTPDTPADQRAWWSLRGTPLRPQLNRARLDAWLDGTLP